MRHRRHRSKLNRTVEHRSALMRNLTIALFDNGVIKTTEPKAKQLRQFADRIITIAKDGLAANEPKGISLAKRRLAFAYLNNKEAVKKLFDEIAPLCAARSGGYTRVVKTVPRQGDGAPMAFIELVDREGATAQTVAEPAVAEEPKKKPRAPRKKAASGDTASA